jgi:uncharacterized protein YceH (UPF0502 family)
LEDVEGTLDGLAARSPDPLVARLERQAGQKEARYGHLLSGEPSAVSAAASHAEADEALPRPDRLELLEHTVDALRNEVAELRAEIAELKRVFE